MTATPPAPPNTTTLDHVAIRVADRESFVTQLLATLDVHVIEQTERFTLVGASPEFGKLTVFDPVDEQVPEARRIVSLVLSESAGAATPTPVTFDGGLVVTFAPIDALGVEWQGTPRHSLVGITLRVSDPPIAAAHLQESFGMLPGRVAPDNATVRVAEPAATGGITFVRERWSDETGPAMLDHVGIRVADAVGMRTDLERNRVEIERWVEAPHSEAVFAHGPDDLLFEFVQQTKPFASGG